MSTEKKKQTKFSKKEIKNDSEPSNEAKSASIKDSNEEKGNTIPKEEKVDHIDKKVLKTDDKDYVEEYSNKKVVAYNRAQGNTFTKVESEITLQDLKDRLKIPSDCTNTAEFILEDDSVFSLTNGLTTQKIKF